MIKNLCKALILSIFLLPNSVFADATFRPATVDTNGVITDVSFTAGSPDEGCSIQFVGDLGTINGGTTIDGICGDGDNFAVGVDLSTITSDGSTVSIYWSNVLHGSGSVNSTNAQEYSVFTYLGGTWTNSTLDYNTTTIYTTTPANGTTTATSTTHTIGATGNLRNEDFNTIGTLRIELENSNNSFQQCSNAICYELAKGSLKRVFTYPITVPAPFGYSSTTQGLPEGKYWVRTTISTGSLCLLGSCLSSTQLYSTSTSFVVGTTTRADNLKTAVVDHMNNLSSGGPSFEGCGITDLNLFTCLLDIIDYAFVPTPDAVSYTVNRVKTEILVKPPFGYITRFINILNSTTSVALPDTSFPIPFGSNPDGTMAFATTSIFQADEIIEGAGEVMEELKDPRSGLSLREITEPMLKVIIWLMAWLLIIKDILGMHKHKQQL